MLTVLISGGFSLVAAIIGYIAHRKASGPTTETGELSRVQSRDAADRNARIKETDDEVSSMSDAASVAGVLRAETGVTGN